MTATAALRRHSVSPTLRLPFTGSAKSMCIVVPPASAAAWPLQLQGIWTNVCITDGRSSAELLMFWLTCIAELHGSAAAWPLQGIRYTFMTMHVRVANLKQR